MVKTGASSTAIGASPLSNKPLYDNSINPEEWRFIHRARTGTLPVLSSGWRTVHHCRKCSHPLETQAHVFCHCLPTSAFRTGRHNDVLELLAGFIRVNTGFRVLVDQTCDLVNRTDRVDLQLIDSARKQIILLDVKCPYDTSDNIKLARDKNIAKYTPLKEDVQRNLPDWKVLLETISVGCLGSWSVENEPVLKSVGLKANIIRKFALISIRKCIT